MVKRIINFVIAGFIAVIVLTVHGAGIPQLINYQGILLDTEGDPITGNRSIEFLLYDVETEGVAVWSETQDVTIADGLFNVLLGSVTPIPYQVFDSTEVYLALKVASDEEMAPRKQLVSVGYAFHANRADNLGGSSASDYLQTVNLVPPADGNINLVEGNNIIIIPDDAANTITIGIDLMLPEIISSIEGVSNDGGNVDLVEGSNVTITPNDAANTITISAAGGTGGDDLGNHTATQNIVLNGNWISNDGGSEGISVSNTGFVGIFGSPLSPYELSVSGDINSTGTVYGDYLFARNGFIKTGTPSSSIAFGDIVATTNLRADNEVIAAGNVRSTAGYIKAGNPVITHNAGDIVASDDVLADDDVQAADDVQAGGMVTAGGDVLSYGRIRTGIPLAAGASGDIASTDDVFADDLIQGNGDGDTFGYLGGASYGVFGRHESSSNYGYLGSSSYGVYSSGNCHVSGTLSKTAGSFRIDHPLDPANKYLQHSFVESPDMMNIYNGNVILDAAGEAVVELPEWFGVLNQDFRYQLTAIGAPGPNLYIAEKITNNLFKISGGEAGMEVSWFVTGIRHDPYADANRIQVEVEKKDKEVGKYQHPEVYGLPVEMRTDYDMMNAKGDLD
ncbi:hypothetical protein HQ585_13115 [candidate division KSB1 bacterium]|nr:hypothetical protein [candidate division KSB1 bacterium]